MTPIVEDGHLIARHWHGRRAGLDREPAETDRIAGDGPASLRLPPMIYHRHLQVLLGPEQGIRIGALSGQEQRAQMRKVVVADVEAARILLFDRTQRRRRGKEARNFVLACDAPKCASVGRSDGLAFVEDGRIAGQERPIDDIGMSDDPADVGCGPEHLAGLDPVKILHRPQQSDHVTAIVAHDALGGACAPRRVEDVERVGSLHCDALCTETLRFSVRDEPRPIVVATRVQLRGSNRALEDDAALGLVSRNLDGLVEKRLVSDDAARLYAARARHDHLGLGIVEAFGELVAGEAAEHDRVDRTEASRGQHRDHCLRHHRHVNDDAVAFFDAEPRQNGRERRHLVAKLTIGERPLGVRYRAIVNERVCRAASPIHMPVEAIVGRVAKRPRKPAAVLSGGRVEHFVVGLCPIDGGGSSGPERFGIGPPALVDLAVSAHQ